MQQIHTVLQKLTATLTPTLNPILTLVIESHQYHCDANRSKKSSCAGNSHPAYTDVTASTVEDRNAHVSTETYINPNLNPSPCYRKSLVLP